MKNMLRLSVTMILLGTLFTIAVEAQRGDGRGPGRGMGHGHGFGPDSCRIQVMVVDLTKDADLTEKQQDQILQIHYTHMEEVEKIRAGYSNDCVGEREALWASRDKMDADVQKILSKEQYEKYLEFMDQRRGPHGHSAHR